MASSSQNRVLSMKPAAVAARKRRAEETPEQREARLAADRARRARNAAATPGTERIRSAQRRENETPELRQARLDAGQQRDMERRENETPEQRQARLDAGQQRDMERRENETPEQRQARLDAGQQREMERRENETPDQRQARLDADLQRHQLAAAVRMNLIRAAVNGTPNAFSPVHHNLGQMSKECQYDFCRALHFQQETGTLLHSCCHDGKVATPPLSPYPEELEILLTGYGPESRNFREFIRQYNSANAFASFGAKTVPIPGHGPYCFKISGEVYHLATSALVQNVEEVAENAPSPRYGQLFVFDPQAAVNYRMYAQENSQCDRRIMEIIDDVMRRGNPYVSEYRRLYDVAQEEEVRARRLGIEPKQYELLLLRKPTDDQRRYNDPVTNRECMYLIESGDGNVPDMDLAVHPIGQRGCQRINHYSRHVDAMTFPIFFPSGDSGWYINVENAISLARAPRTSPTPLQFYSSRIAVRPGRFNQLHHGGKLFQQYLVHAYCIVEAQRLNYIRYNQKQLRVECYQGLIDFLAEAAQEQSLRPGNLMILPSTFVGSPRYMRQKYYDAMTIVRKFGRPDLFITFTCNPKWPEIQAQLAQYQDATARPDIVSRVFQLKVNEMMRLIKKEKIFGDIQAFVYVIEFQKRGLPHLHSLFWLTEVDRCHSGDDVDRIVSAEIPNRTQDQALYNIVIRNNIHGPCGVLNPNSICMSDGECKKRFPKPFQEATDTSGDGYPKYRRRDNTHENHCINHILIDNRWVVPYNPFLSKMFDAHINVELCHTIEAVKYLLKYFTKGHDRARVGLKVVNGQLVLNEVQEFVDTRCITPPEAMWRLLENDIHQQSHSIQELAVHLENGQSIFFQEGQEEEAMRQAATRDTTLTAWFKLNQIDPQARQFLYQQIPEFFTCQKQGGNVRWQIRQRGGNLVIGRVATVSPRNVELYHLRLILLNVRGATSFTELRTVNGQIYDTYREAAHALGLIVDDEEWRRCLQEAVVWMMPNQLRSLFAVLLINCEVNNANDLWNEFRNSMTEDFRHQGNDEASAATLALLQIQSDLHAAGTNCTEKGIPEPGPMAEAPQLFDDNPITYSNRGEEMRVMLNQEQRIAAEAILDAVSSDDNTRARCFFVDGPGGSGKTFLYETLINILRGMHKKVLSVAFTGIAAILLPGGKTCHTAFRLPLDIHPDSSCHLSVAEKISLREVDVIIWDEISMTSKNMLGVVDRLLRDLMNNDAVPFGGKVVVTGGDFRQVLPVMPNATRNQIVNNTLRKSPLSPHFQRFGLTVNMRARPSELEFTEWLLQLGNGTLPHPQNAKTENSVVIPPQCVCPNVVNKLFGDSFLPTDTRMHQRVVLCPINEDVRLRNEEILDKLYGQKSTFKSVDYIGAVEGENLEIQQQMLPVEFLNTVNLTGLPPHELNLKKGAVVILIRNLCLARGLCNGTRLIIEDMQPKVLKVRIISGAHRGTIHFLPRITLNTKDDVNVPFNLCRRQFPVKLAYAMTINKSQGQTLDQVGIFLRAPVFTHGQLYVASSRVRSFDSLFLQVFDDQQQGRIGNDVMTDNIVFQEVL